MEWRDETLICGFCGSLSFFVVDGGRCFGAERIGCGERLQWRPVKHPACTDQQLCSNLQRHAHPKWRLRFMRNPPHDERHTEFPLEVLGEKRCRELLVLWHKDGC